MTFKWMFKQATTNHLAKVLTEYPGCAFHVEPMNDDGTALTRDQVAAFGRLKLHLVLSPPSAPIVLNDSFPCPPICGE